MSDGKYFQRGKIQELRAELASDKTVKGVKKRDVLKKIVANMTMGNDMSQLFPDVLNCMNLGDVDVKKMVYLYLMNYSKSKPDLAMMAVNSLLKDIEHFNPLVRALALRTMSYIPVDKIQDNLCDPLRKCMKDNDPYVRKTAAICVAKLYSFSSKLCIREGFIDGLKEMLSDANATVVANAVCAYREIADSCDEVDLTLTIGQASKLITALSECSEWGQTYILELLMFVVPTTGDDAEMMCERLMSKLQHANAAVCLTAVRLIMYMLNFVTKQDVITGYCRKMSSPLVTLFSGGPEIQYTALRSISLIVQKRPEVLKNDIKVFFCKYNDPIYVKMAKLEIIMRLVSESNVDQVLIELKEYASEVDIDFVRRAVRSIGRCAIKVDTMADKSIASLIELIKTKVSYVVQEAIVVVRDIFRKYPGRYEQLISTLCDYLDSLDEPEAKAAMIWIIGQYADRIDAATALLDTFLYTIKEDTAEVKLALLTAVVKLTIKRPAEGTALFSRLINYCVNDSDDPDLRDRAFIYYRLLTNSPQAAAAVVFSEKPTISTETDNTPAYLLDELLLHIGALASVVHKPPSAIVTEARQRNATILASRIAGSAHYSQQQQQQQLLQQQQQQGGGMNAYAAYNPYGNDAGSSPVHKRAMVNMGINLIDVDVEENADDYDAPFALSPGGASSTGPTSPYSTMHPYVNAGDDHSTYSTVSRVTMSPSQVSLQSYGSAAISSPAHDILDLGRGSATPYRGPPVPLGQSPSAATTLTRGQQQQQQQQPIMQNPDVASQLADLNLGGGGNVDVLADIFGKPPLSTVGAAVAWPKAVWLTPQTGRGLEIVGTYSRRNGQVYMDMTMANRSLTVLDNFAFAINKNTFSLSMAEPLAIQALPKNAVVDTSLRLKVEGIPVLCSPVNLVQACIRTNAGQPIFETSVPLFVLFAEHGGIEKAEFLRIWRDIGDERASQANFATLSPQLGSLDTLKARLHACNVFVVAERMVDNQPVLYCSSQLADRTTFLCELRPNLAEHQCTVMWKTYASHLTAEYVQSLEFIVSTSI
ncbi:hypothetical protein RI367_004908 [Sorochytrium milnesiophthora]